MRGRGGFGGRGRGGRQTHTALLRAGFVSKDRTNSARRLQRDYKELTDAREPLVGVAAQPLPNDLYTWHGNLRGPAGTPWAAGVFHFEMTIPRDYPCSPPDIQLYTPIPHPNVFGRRLCLDMLEVGSKAIYEGWVSAYTIEAVLIQLQSFLFETLPDDIQDSKGIRIAHAVKQANDFTCSVCKHRGPLSADPAFAANEATLADFVMLKSPQELLKEELVCFQTKMPLKEGTLGIGITLKKSPRTGLCMYVNPTMDLMNMRAFTKLKVRKSLANERFTHWLPLYFGETETFDIESEDWSQEQDMMVTTTKTVNTFERFEKHFCNSLSFIANGSTTKPYNHESVLEVMPKLISTHIIDMMKENRHISIIALRRVFNFIRLFAHLAAKDAKIQQELDAKLKAFIEDPAMRTKTNCKMLLDMQVASILTNKHDYQKFTEAYVEEQLDRQVLWILKDIPELDFENKKLQNKGKVNEKDRSRVSFECGKTGYYLTLFFYHLHKTIAKVTPSRDLTELAKVLDSNHGCLSFELENAFQQELFQMQRGEKAVDDFFKYYACLGVAGAADDKQLNERLVQAVKNSRQKGYHGQDGGLIGLPSVADQSQTRIQKLLTQFVDLKLQQEEIKRDIKADAKDPGDEDQKPKVKQHVKGMLLKESLKEASEEEWKQLCIKNFSFIQQEFESKKDTQMTAAKLAAMSDEAEIGLMREALEDLKQKEDKMAIELRARLQQNESRELREHTLAEDYASSFSYRLLFIKLTFEFLQRDLQYNQDFEMIYEYIKTFGKDLTCLKLKVIDKMCLKSNHYWLMAIIPKLTSLKTLKLYQNEANSFGEDGHKFLQKAMNYFHKNGGLLQKVQMSNVYQRTSGDFLYPTLKCLPDLQILSFKDNMLAANDCKAIGKVLSDFKNIRELDLRNCMLDTTKGKEIADGLMRAKQLEIIKLNDNQAAGLNCSQMIYNLAFSPKIRVIDVSNIIQDSQMAAVVEAFYKLLKISGSIQTLLMGGSRIATHLTKDFCIALGESKTIEHLNIDLPASTSAQVSSTVIKLLGQACAINKMKNGALRHLSMRNSSSDIGRIQDFLSSFRVSEKQHEEWYGELKVANEMKHDQLVKKLYCGLQFLDLGGCRFGASSFKVKNFEILNDPVWPEMVKFIAQTQLPVLDLRACWIASTNVELFTCAIGKNPVAACQHLKVLNLANNSITRVGAKLLAPALEANQSIEFLDLSQNHLGVYGVTLIAKALQQNSTLKGLNLFKNTLDVDGARALRDMLKVNHSIEFLDVGHNRIRSKGLEAISEGILHSEQCKLQTLGLRMNFINDDGFARFFEEVVLSGMSKLENLYVTQNNLSEHKALRLAAELARQEMKVYVDQFEKLLYQSEERMAKTLWFGPINPGNYESAAARVAMVKQFRPAKCGLFKMPMRFKNAKKIPGRLGRPNVYMLVEFEDEASVANVTKMVSGGKFALSRKCFRAGTNTYVQIKRSTRK